MTRNETHHPHKVLIVAGELGSVYAAKALGRADKPVFPSSKA